MKINTKVGQYQYVQNNSDSLNMQISAKLIQILPLQTGTGKNGTWKKKDIIVETEGQYPKKICISIWGDKIDESLLQLGNLLKIDFDIESREYNGRWFTDIKAWKIEIAGNATSENQNSILPDDNSTLNDEDIPF